mgnify:CR=1 FL=1
MLLAIFVYPPDEEATLRAAAEAVRLAAEADKAALAEFVRREERRKDLTHPETKAELERDTARAERIYVSLEGHREPNIQSERDSGHPDPEGHTEPNSRTERESGHPDLEVKTEPNSRPERESGRPSPEGNGEPNSQPEKKNRVSRMWKRIKGGRKEKSRSENKAV